jgi:hypothetical protein
VAWPDTADTTGAPYALPYPGDNDVADVPKTLKALAEAIETALDKKVEKVAWTKSTGSAGDSADVTYQRKIKVQTQSPIVAPPTGTLYEGDVVFVVP